MPADASAGYVHERLEAEREIQEASPRALIARLGWQVAQREASSTLAHLDARMRDRGRVAASSRRLPACAFVDVTAAALPAPAARPPGTYLLGANRG